MSTATATPTDSPASTAMSTDTATTTDTEPPKADILRSRWQRRILEKVFSTWKGDAEEGNHAKKHMIYDKATADVAKGMMFWGGGESPMGLNPLLVPDPDQDRVNEGGWYRSFEEDNEAIDLRVDGTTGLVCYSREPPRICYYGGGDWFASPFSSSIFMTPLKTDAANPFGVKPETRRISVPASALPSSMLGNNSAALTESVPTDMWTLMSTVRSDRDIVSCRVRSGDMGEDMQMRNYLHPLAFGGVVCPLAKKLPNDVEPTMTVTKIEDASFIGLLERQKQAGSKNNPYSFLHEMLSDDLATTLELVVLKRMVAKSHVDRLSAALEKRRVKTLLAVLLVEDTWYYVEFISCRLELEPGFRLITPDVTQSEYHEALKSLAREYGKERELRATMKVNELECKNPLLPERLVVKGKDMVDPGWRKIIHDNFPGYPMEIDWKVYFKDRDGSREKVTLGPFLPKYVLKRHPIEFGSFIFVDFGERDGDENKRDGEIVMILAIVDDNNYLAVKVFSEPKIVQLKKSGGNWYYPLPGGGLKKSTQQVGYIKTHITAMEVLDNLPVRQFTSARDNLLKLRTRMLTVYFPPRTSRVSEEDPDDRIRKCLNDTTREMALGVAATLRETGFRKALPNMFEPVSSVHDLTLPPEEPLQLAPGGLYLGGLNAFQGRSPLEASELLRQKEIISRNGAITSSKSLSLTITETPFLVYEGGKKMSLTAVGDDFLGKGIDHGLQEHTSDVGMKHDKDSLQEYSASEEMESESDSECEADTSTRTLRSGNRKRRRAVKKPKRPVKVHESDNEDSDGGSAGSIKSFIADNDSNAGEEGDDDLEQEEILVDEDKLTDEEDEDEPLASRLPPPSTTTNPRPCRNPERRAEQLWNELASLVPHLPDDFMHWTDVQTLMGHVIDWTP